MPVAVVVALACATYAQDTASDEAKGLLEKGVSQFQAFDFKAAKETLLKVDRAKLTDANKATYDEYLGKVDPAIRGQAAATEAFKNAEKALKANDLVAAKEGYTKAAASEYIQPQMRTTAQAQLALVDKKIELANAAASPASNTATAPAPAATPAPGAQLQPTPAPAPLPPPAVNEESPVLSRATVNFRLAKQAAELAFQKAMNEASQRLRTAKIPADFDAAQTSIEQARNILETNKIYFTNDEYQGHMMDVDNRLAEIKNRQLAWNLEQVRIQQEEIARDKRDRDIQARRQKQNKIDQLVQRAKALIKQENYEGAVNIGEQVLQIEPTNEWANESIDMLRQLGMLRTEGNLVKTRDIEDFKQAIANREAEIPWWVLVRYPDDWRAITTKRAKYAAGVAAVSEEDREALMKLRNKVPRLDFAESPLQDVLSFLRDTTGANIVTNWPALTAAGVDRTTKITLRLINVSAETALQKVLEQAGGATAVLTYVVDHGVITISTKDDLSKKTLTRVYDISDLIVRVPNFSSPRINLASNTGNNAGGAGGGIFGNTSTNTGNAGNEENIPTKQEIINNIKNMITEQVDRDTWVVNGGTIGTLSELGGQLVVTQTSDAQDKLAKLINSLREARALQISIEARFIQVNTGYLESIGLDLNAVFNIGSSLGGNVTRDANGTITGPTDPFTGVVVKDTSTPSGWGDSFPGNKKWTPINVSGGSFKPGGFTDMVGKGGGPVAGVTTPALSIGGTFLDDIQVDFLLQATQASGVARTLTAPRITIFNGQRAYVTVGTQQAYISSYQPTVSDNTAISTPIVSFVPTGSVLDVEGTVSADKRYVTMTVRPQVANLQQIITVDTPVGPLGLPTVIIQDLQTTCNCPDKGTLLLGGQRLVNELQNEEGVPLLSKIPIINRAFTTRNMTRNESTLLILIKPTIIIQEEQEAEAAPPE